MKLKLVPATSIAVEKIKGFVSYEGGASGIGDVEHHTYEKTWGAVRFKAMRRQAGLTLLDAANRLGIRVSQVSGLESGAFTCDWDLAENLLTEPETIR